MKDATTTMRLTVLAAIVALVAIAGVIVTAATLSHGIDAHSTPILTTVIGLIGTTVTALIALLAVVGVDRKVNGHMSRLTEIAVQAAQQSNDPELVKKADEAVAIAESHGATVTPTEGDVKA